MILNEITFAPYTKEYHLDMYGIERCIKDTVDVKSALHQMGVAMAATLDRLYDEMKFIENNEHKVRYRGDLVFADDSQPDGTRRLTVQARLGCVFDPDVVPVFLAKK